MTKFALGEEDLARQIFPVGIDMKITALGSNGFFASEFSAIYPKNLNFFIPIDYVTNNVSNAIPAEFESFFHPLDDFLEYFGRLTEMRIPSEFSGKGVEFAVGKFSDFDYKGSRHNTFAISAAKPGGTVSLLCRQLISGGSTVIPKTSSGIVGGIEDNAVEILLSEIAATVKPSFLDVADSLKVEEDIYVYWNMSPRRVFANEDLAIAGLMLSTPHRKPARR